MAVGGRRVKENGETPAKIGSRVQQGAEAGLAYMVAKTADDLYFDKPYGPDRTAHAVYSSRVGFFALETRVRNLDKWA